MQNFQFGATEVKRLKVVMLAMTLVMSAMPAQADFGVGLAAYDAGNYAVARAEWLALAEKGDPVSQTALGALYAEGAGVGRNFSIAAQWFRRAAEQGDMVAQLNLGDYFARGKGVPRDLTAAWLWLSLAARQGNEWAAERRDAVAMQLTDAAQCEAARQLAGWRPTAR
jgi:TPR repeat protein